MKVLHTHLLHVFGLRGRGVPAVVENEDVGAGESLVDLVKKGLFLDRHGRNS